MKKKKQKDLKGLFIRIDKDLHRKLKEHAARTGESITQFIQVVLKAIL
jgi:predicted HicB family RNase H-like nuclease